MKRLFPTLLISTVLLACPTIFAQAPTSYSESKPYSPLLVESPKTTSQKKPKKAADVKAVVSASSEAIIANASLTIPVAVLNKDGEPVRGLEKADFKLFVDSDEVEIVSVQSRSEPVTIVLVVDASPSSRDHLDAIKELSSRLVAKLRPEDKVMVVGLNMKMKVLLEPTTDRNAVDKALAALAISDGTSIFQTVSELYEKVLPTIAEPSAVILFTDGVDTTSQVTYQKSLADAEKGKAAVFPIYIDTYDPNADPRVVASKVSQAYPRAGTVPFGIASPSALYGRPNGPETLSGLTKQEHAFARIYLTELLKASGGRPVMFNDLQAGKLAEFDRIPQEILSRYYLTVRLTGSRKVGDRRAIKIRVSRPDLKLLAKGSYVER